MYIPLKLCSCFPPVRQPRAYPSSVPGCQLQRWQAKSAAVLAAPERCTKRPLLNVMPTFARAMPRQ